MNKAGANAKWAALTAEQRATVERWLMEEKVSLPEALKRAREQFDFRGSRTSLQRLGGRFKQERLAKRLLESGRGALEVARNGISTGTLMTAGLKVLGHQFWEQMQAEPEEIPDVLVMVKLLLQSEANQIQREENLIRQQAVNLRQRAQEFTERRWEYDLAEEAMARLPELQELKEAKIDANDPYAENKRVNAIRRRLYGRHDIPGAYPENDEEAATYETRIAAEKAEQERAYEVGARVGQKYREAATTIVRRS